MSASMIIFIYSLYIYSTKRYSTLKTIVDYTRERETHDDFIIQITIILKLHLNNKLK